MDSGTFLCVVDIVGTTADGSAKVGKNETRIILTVHGKALYKSAYSVGFNVGTVADSHWLLSSMKLNKPIMRKCQTPLPKLIHFLGTYM